MKKSFIILLIGSFLLVLMGCGSMNYKKISLNRYEYAESTKPYDVLVVPGTPYHKEGMTNVMLYRLLWAKFIYDKGFSDKIIFSGAAVYSPFVESCIMKQYAIQMGIPADDILLETQAETSVDNIYYSNLLARENELKDLLVVTDMFQSLRFSRFQKQTNIQFNLIPMQKDSIDLDFRFKVEINDSICYQKGWVDYKKRKASYERFAKSGGMFLPKEVIK